MTPRLIALGLAGAALIGGLAWVALRPEPVAVDLHAVRAGPLQGLILADGRTRIRQIYDVAAPVAGTARRSPVRVGDRVVEGETVVAVVEPVAAGLLDARARAEAQAALRQAEAALSVAASRLRQAEEDRDHAAREYARARTLLERGVASLARVEDAAQVLALREAGVETARAELAVAEGARDRAAAVLSAPAAADGGGCCVEIRAPASGVVLAVEQISERPVAAGAPLLSIGDPADLEIVADLLSSEAVRLAPGARAEVDRWGGPAPLSRGCRGSSRWRAPASRRSGSRSSASMPYSS
jgi:HlyD family secretion protein